MKKGKLFLNGNIITMDEQNSIYDAVYVVDGVIEAVGKEKELRSLYKDYEVIDLKGNTMLPGFIEPHAHFDLCSMFSKMNSVSGIDLETSENVLNELKKIVKNTPKGKWIMCFGLDYLINSDLPEMNRYFLDKLTTDHPITIIIQSMHTIYCNSLALERGGITRDTKDTRDGHCIKDENGEPLGILTEQGFIVPLFKLWLKEMDVDPMKFLKDEAILWRNLGITTTWTAGYYPLFKNHFKLMNDFFNKKDTPIRGDYSLSYNSIEGGYVSDEDMKAPQSLKTKFTGVKFWYDGSPYTGNMLMYENYLENDTMQRKLFIPKNQHGEKLFDPEFLYSKLKEYHIAGHQISIHAQGDESCHEVLLLLKRLLEEYPREDHRHRLEHCAFIDKEDLILAAKLGVTISFHVNHLYYYGEALKDIVLGEKAVNKMLSCKSALKEGIRISLHSDAPMYSPNALRVAGGAVTRKTRTTGVVIGEEERLTVTEALRAITIDAAWQIKREKEIGSIEVGKLADFTIIKENPYNVMIDHIKDIEVVTTYLSGEDTITML